MGEIVVSAVRQESIQEAWPTAAPLIQRALDHARGEMTLGDVLESINSGVFLLVLIHRSGELVGASTLEITDQPQKKLCGIVTLGGHDVDEWLDDFLECVYKLAKEQGATEVRASGRKGWEKKLKPRGFTTAYTVYAKVV